MSQTNNLLTCSHHFSQVISIPTRETRFIPHLQRYWRSFHLSMPSYFWSAVATYQTSSIETSAFVGRRCR